MTMTSTAPPSARDSKINQGATKKKASQKITLKTADGIALQGEHRQCRPASPSPKATIIAVHGFTASRAETGFQVLLNICDRPEMNLITYDSRGHGKSEGETTFGNREYMDVEAAVNLALLETSPILLVGVSAGAAGIVNYLYNHEGRKNPGLPEQIAGALLISSPATWKGRFGISSLYVAWLLQTKQGRKRLQERHGVKLKLPIEIPIAPVDAVPEISLPLAFVGGTEDKLLGARAARQLFEKATPPKRLELAAGAGHGPSRSLGEAVERGIDWLIKEAL